MKDNVIVAFTTCPEAAAAAIAEALVRERLAACVNQIPSVRSTYLWKDAVTQDQEDLLMIKTTRDRFEALAARIQTLHPYEVPELIALPVDAGSDPYLAWVRACTGATPEA
ncbi:MAG TPA: divalent-cation tolerance protein CutA [Steroidobacteraceae bacterium]|nr:divalent-cation tolerance protein CutA [Steroidobacteraceae bacterium]